MASLFREDESIDTVGEFLKLHLNDKNYGMKKNNNDKFFLFTGLTGSGKSNTVLHFFHAWYNEVLEIGAKPEYFDKFFSARIDGFARALKEVKQLPYHMIVHDEIIQDLHSKDGGGKISKKLYQTYNVIRGKRIFTAGLIPNLCDFSKDFVKERVQHIVHCYKDEGRYYAIYFSPQDVSKLVPKMFQMQEKMKRGSGEDRPDIRLCEVEPSMKWEVKNYRGVYKKQYEALKESNMDATIDELYELVNEGKSESIDPKEYKQLKTRNRIIDLMAIGKNYREIAIDVDMTTNALRNFVSNNNLVGFYNRHKHKGVSNVQ